MVENAAVRALRLLDLVPFIVANPGITVKELAREFEISTESLIKDLNLLFMCGLPGYTPLELIDLSFDDGAVIVRDPQNLSLPRNLSESEALAIRIALAALEELTPASHKSFSVIRSLSQKIAAAFASEIPKGAIDFVADREQRILATIEQAIAKDMDLEITYVNSTQDRTSIRRITPRALSILPERTLVKAFCHTAQNERSFNLKFIVECICIAREKHLPEPAKSFDSTILVTLEISDESSQFLQTHRQELHQKSESPEPQSYEMTIYQPEWIIRTVISEPSSVRLRRPHELRKAILERSNAALEQYGVIG